MKKYIAEFTGTYFLTLGVGLSLILGMPVITPFVAALTLGVFVYTIGGISGAQLNPAVTFGLMVVKKMKTMEGLKYMISQVFGAALAYVCIRYFAGMTDYTYVLGEEGFKIAMGELYGAFILTFGVCSVVYGKVKDAASGLTIGGSLFLGILLASATANGVLNPAVALGISSFSFSYLVGPLVGGAFAALLYDYLTEK